MTCILCERKIAVSPEYIQSIRENAPQRTDNLIALLVTLEAQPTALKELDKINAISLDCGALRLAVLGGYIHLQNVHVMRHPEGI